MEVPVTINGVCYPKAKRADFKPFACTIVGQAWVTGLGVGGGPIIPEPGEPPIDVPPPDMIPSEPKPPPPNGGWGWSPEYGWGYFPGPGEASPKKP